MATLLLGLILTVYFELRVTNGQALGFVLNGVNYPSGSTVLRSDIGEGADALQCTTDRVGCCTGAGRAGEFYFPNDIQVPVSNHAPSNSYYRDRDTGFIRLNRRPTAIQTGRFRCRIYDTSGMFVNLYINIVDGLPTTPTTPPVTTTQPGTVSIAISITASGTNTAGETYSQECSATVTGSIDQPAIFWLDAMSNPVPSEMVTTTGSRSTLTFNPLAASHAGTYTCGAFVAGAIEIETVDMTVRIPKPMVTVISDQPNPIMPVGSDVTLTCTVELSPGVDIPVTVNTVWTGPAGFMTTNTAQPVMGSNATYTSTAMVSSFIGRNHSGVYTCTATVSSTTSSFLTNSMASSSARVTVGVYLSLKGVIYPNNSVIYITEIERTNTTSNNGLQCITDRRPCCAAANLADRLGRWFFPNNGGKVPPIGSGENRATTFFMNRGNDGTINLNRLNTDVMMPTGRFCCVVLDATDVNKAVCAIIFGISVSITPSGTNTVGETYSLECSATVSLTGSTNLSTFIWLDTMNNPVPSEMVTTTGSMSTLTFNPLATSHARTYTCRVTARGVTETQISSVIVNVITAHVTRSSSGPLTTGQTGFFLSCDVTGTENLKTPTFTYQWRKNSGVISGQQGSILSLSPLAASNAGEYNCSITVSSTSLSSTVTVKSSNTDIVSLLLLQPNVHMSLISNSPNSILSGSSVTLTCTVELSPKVDIPVTVNTVWTGPALTSAALNHTPTIQESLTLYRSVNVLNFVESTDSGQYSCTIEVVSGVRLSATTSIKIVDGMFQLRLKGVDICKQWYIERSSKEATKYANHIETALIEGIERRCKCHFPVANLIDDFFSCEESPDLMMYRGTLIGTYNFNGSLILGFIQDWVSSGPWIKFDTSRVRVDSSCPVALSSLNDPECGLKEVCLTSTDDPDSFAVCAEKLDNRNVTTCFRDCIVHNG